MAELLYRFWQHKSQRARRQPLPSSLTESLLVSYWTLARKVASAKRRIVFSVILWRLTMRPADAYRLKYRSDGTASQTIDPDEPSDRTRRIEAEARSLYGPNVHVSAEGNITIGDAPPPSSAPTFLRRVPKRDVRRIHVTRGVDDDTGLFRPVEVSGTRGRIIGDAGVRSVQDLHDPEYEGGDEPMTSRGPFDILVTDDVTGDEREWIKSWWRSEVDESMKEYIGCTCAVVGREILIFGGPNELHLAQRMYNIDLSARQGFRNEESDTLFSLDGLDPRFRRFGERLAEQSDRGAAAVVYV